MNKLLILAFTVAFSSFTVADEVVSPEPADEATVSATPVEVTFKTLDANQDNVISLTEAEAQKELLIAFIDTDVDRTGDISEVEYNKFAMLSK